ncbi:hypothetical protein SH601_05220 [Gracilibacillus sp. S3-1-1]|uniref:Uncharacterized protein n=1 Tax=Gracilibacillus pellucidus TaxID=3095368 RepID=A0ACC6M355_9BACI|nr:hypothetical protein [Gracilibacillus sp. S3-1-1]MDX8045385.1 hypothetical protein [Gracilibacillus sp. S3-1-1]
MLKCGKTSARKGKFVLLEDVLNDAIKRAYEGSDSSQIAKY